MKLTMNNAPSWVTSTLLASEGVRLTGWRKGITRILLDLPFEFDWVKAKHEFAIKILEQAKMCADVLPEYGVPESSKMLDTAVQYHTELLERKSETASKYREDVVRMYSTVPIMWATEPAGITLNSVSGDKAGVFNSAVDLEKVVTAIWCNLDEEDRVSFYETKREHWQSIMEALREVLTSEDVSNRHGGKRLGAGRVPTVGALKKVRVGRTLTLIRESETNDPVVEKWDVVSVGGRNNEIVQLRYGDDTITIKAG